MKRMVLTLIVLCFSMKAEMKVKDYRLSVRSSNAQVRALNETYISGLGQGMQWANAGAQKPLFCIPPATPFLNPGNYMEIIDWSITENSFKESAPIGKALLFGLIGRFPCEAAK